MRNHEKNPLRLINMLLEIVHYSTTLSNCDIIKLVSFVSKK
jgi:hypothetical protein